MLRFLIINSNRIVKGGNDFVAYEQHKILSNYSKVHSRIFTVGKIQLPFTNYFFSMLNLVRLLICVSRYKPHFIFVHSFSGNLSNSILFLLKYLRAKKFFFVHDYKLICPISSMYRWDNSTNRFIICQECPSKKNIKYVLDNRCNRSSYFFSLINFFDFKIANLFSLQLIFDKFVFVSDYTKRIISSYSEEISKKSVLLYNSVVDIEDGNYIPFANKVFDFVFVGRLSKEKGIIEFCEFCKKNDLNVKILIIGEGELKVDLQKNFSGLVNCIGFKSGVEKIDYIKKSKFLIFPSLWLENNPIVLIESQCLSIPALAHSIGGVPEIITNNFNGFLYSTQEDLLNSIKSTLSITELEYDILSKNSRNTYLKKFNSQYFIDFVNNVVKIPT